MLDCKSSGKHAHQRSKNSENLTHIRYFYFGEAYLNIEWIGHDTCEGIAELVEQNEGKNQK